MLTQVTAKNVGIVFGTQYGAKINKQARMGHRIKVAGN